ncbi:oligosaccharide flippase family protein [Conexibacter sp. W3-3-2]|uniref:flippase n=1 Tax=Conexibacter sp. W3-3-2 TaxID=2675227 RepID=UPI0012B6F5A0|nr:flippase [Conexibacter sp. W3-3-2]MTD43082.1 oligosaccharide flippase family protein [Conexibacter sp. W3-3-2]
MSTPAAGNATRRIAGNTALQAAADGLGKLGTIVLYAVLAREAGVAAFGDFTTAASLSVLVMVAAFGMDFRVTRLVAQGDPDVGPSIWGAVLLKLAGGTAILLVVCGIAALGPYSDRVVATTAVLGLAMIVELTTMTPHAVFRGHEDLRPVALALLLYRGLLSVLGVAVLLAGGSILLVAVGWLLGALAGLAYTLLRARRAGLRHPFVVTRAGLRAVATDSLGLGLAAVLGAALSRLDIVLLGALKDSEAVALYGGAYRLMESTFFITSALALSAFPALSRLTRTSTPSLGEAVALTTKAVLVTTVPLAVGFVAYAEPVLVAIYGDGLRDATGTLQILGVLVITTGIYSLMAFVLTSQQAQRPIVVALVVTTVLNVAANLALIPSMGAEGAAWSWAATTTVLAAMLLVAVLRDAGRVPVLRTVEGPLLGGLAMIAVAVATGAHAWGIPLAGAAFAVVLVTVERRRHPDDAVRLRLARPRGA